MFKRNVTTSLMVVAAGVLMFSGVALAANQQAPAAKAPVLVSQTSEPTDDSVKATASPELEPGDDNGVDATPSAEPTFDDKGGAGHGADDAASPTAEPTPDDKGGAGHGADDTASPTATPDDKGGAGHGADDTTSPTATPAATPDDKGGKGGHGGGSDD